MDDSDVKYPGHEYNITWLSGGIGIHKRLKISRPAGLAGSSPASATIN